MNQQQFILALQKRWWLVLICFLAVGTGAYLASKFTTPIYQSVALVQVSIGSAGSDQSNLNSLLASSQLVQTEAQLATSDPVLHEVASHYPKLSTNQLAKEVSSTPIQNTQLFEIDVQDTSPTRAAALANDIAITLIKQQTQGAQQDNGQLSQQLRQELDTTWKQIQDTATRIATLQTTKGNSTQIAVLQAKLTTLEQHYSQWDILATQLKLNQSPGGGFLQVVQKAQPVFSQIKPSNLINTAEGLAAGLLLGILLAMLFELLDARIRTVEELTQLSGWPVLATIWRARTTKKEDVFNPTGCDAYVEAYRILRTNLGLAMSKKPIRSLMITSVQSQDGKSIIAANLAIFMAKAGKTTLLVDADLRHPTQHDLFDLPDDAQGLSEAIRTYSMQISNCNTSSAQQLFFPCQQPQSEDTLITTQTQKSDKLNTTGLHSFVHPTKIPNLWLMPSGSLPPDPPELLASKAMQQLLVEIANSRVEIVIFDTPCAPGLSDASILASKVDGTLVVIDMTRIDKRALAQIKALLTQSSMHVLGYVLNKQRRTRRDRLYSYSNDDGRSDKATHNIPSENTSSTSPNDFVPLAPVKEEDAHALTPPVMTEDIIEIRSQSKKEDTHYENSK